MQNRETNEGKHEMTAFMPEPVEDPDAQFGICPRCGQNTLRLDRPALNALSRTDNDTYICSDCGQQEAFADLARGFERQSKEKWRAPDKATLHATAP